GLAVVDLLYALNLTEKDRAGIESNHLEPLIKAGVLEECTAIPEHGKQKKLLPRVAYRLKKDLLTLQEIINAFDTNIKMENEIVLSQYWADTALAIAYSINESIQHISGLRRFDIEIAGEPPEEIEQHEKKYYRLMKSPDMRIRNLMIKTLGPLQTFNADEMNEIIAALRSNWLMMKFAVHYLSLDDDKKKECLLQVIADARSNTIAAAKLKGISAMGRSILDESTDVLLSDKPEDKAKASFVAEIFVRATENAEKDLFGRRAPILPIWLCDFFNYLKYMRDRYLLPPN
ncbi:MAG: hypothetical protein GWP10_16285, partial [Nitrospiraceae bacterium]|nr:hypothetical protein [Nitrospiraceae bacterium]